MLLNKVFYDINLKLLVNYQLRLSIYDSLIVSSSFLYWYRLNVFWILKIMTWISQIFQFPWIHTKNHATYMAFGGFVETWSSSAPLVNRCHFRNLRLHVCCYRAYSRSSRIVFTTWRVHQTVKQIVFYQIHYVLEYRIMTECLSNLNSMVPWLVTRPFL